MNKFTVIPFMRGEKIYIKVEINGNIVEFNYEEAEKLNRELNEILACNPKEDLWEKIST